MLMVTQYCVAFQEVHKVAGDNMLHDLTACRCQGYRSVVGSLACVPFLEQRGDAGSLPVFQNLTLIM